MARCRLHLPRAQTRSGNKPFNIIRNGLWAETHVRRLPGKTNNDRAVRIAASWYRVQLAGGTGESSAPEGVMISDGEGNVEKTKREEIVCCLHRFALVSQEVEGLIGRRDSRPKEWGRSWCCTRSSVRNG